MSAYDHQLLQEALASFSAPPLTQNQEADFEAYAALLSEVGSRMNLTAILDPAGIALLHFADSLTLPLFVPIQEGARVLDVGSGAGFPMVPLSILRRDLDCTCMDSTVKKVRFLQSVADTLSLPLRCVACRAEEAGRDASMREQYDLVTARAVSRLNKLAELCLPFCRVGGLFAAMKGPGGREEADEAARGISLLGGEISHIREFSLPNGEQRTLILVKKVRHTPTAYPRDFRKIAAKPL